MTSADTAKHDKRAREEGLGRRRFLVYLVAAPTLTLAARLGIDTATPTSALAASPTATDPDLGGAQFVLTVTTANKVIFESPKPEVGQGISTALTMLLAEEMDLRLTDIELRMPMARPGGASQSVGGSNSIRSMWKPVRDLGAQARSRLVAAAAERWGVPAATLTTRDTSVYAPDGRSATYGSLAVAAARVASTAVATKPASTYKVIGTGTKQHHVRDIVTGKVKFAQDVSLPGALATVVARPPTLNGTVSSYDPSGAIALGAKVTKLPTGVAVSAPDFYLAQKARDALRVTWGAGTVDGVSQDKVEERLRQATPPFVDPPLLSVFVDGAFDFAFVNHAPMEVNNAVAHVRADRAELWLPTKNPVGVRDAVATATGLPAASITVNATRAGGSFGRRIFNEHAIEAALVSKAIGAPVKLMWTRADDMKHGRMRPASYHRMRLTYLNGKVYSYQNTSSSVLLNADLPGIRDAVVDVGLGGYPSFGTAVFALTQTVPYDFGVVTTELNEVPLDMPTAYWRSVYSGHNRVAEEIMVDQLAKRLGKDSLQLREDSLKAAEAKAVMRELRTRGGWGKGMAPGWAQGVAFHSEYNAHVACLVEINATNPQTPRVTKAVVVADMGRVVNPAGAQAQLMGSVMDGISTVLQAGNHLQDGAMVENSFTDFRYGRQRHAPLTFETYFLNTQRDPGGAGELAVPAAGGAVANAYARATGRVPYRFPING